MAFKLLTSLFDRRKCRPSGRPLVKQKTARGTDLHQSAKSCRRTLSGLRTRSGSAKHQDCKTQRTYQSPDHIFASKSARTMIWTTIRVYFTCNMMSFISARATGWQADSQFSCWVNTSHETKWPAEIRGSLSSPELHERRTCEWW